MIKRKDGTPYKLSSPNSLLSNQSFWRDDEKVILHNLSPEETTLESTPVEEIVVPIKTPPKTLARCLPMETKTVHDSLYDETRSYSVPGQKCIVEIIPLESNDLTSLVWTEIKINVSSILYFDRRWWKVNSLSEENGGFLLGCIISDLQPSFD